MEKREDLVAALISLREQEESIREKIQQIDYNENFSEKSQFVGKFYKQIEEHNLEYIRCFYVYGIDEDSCNLNTLIISYWVGNDNSFEIEHNFYFDPTEEEDYLKYKEINVGEFAVHYFAVQKIINKATSSIFPITGL